MIKRQIALIVLDGWGYREDPTNNAIATAKKPIFDDLWAKYPHTTLEASGFAVGLPEGQMGNSEVGHTTIGSGKVIDQDLVRIDKAIISKEFEKNLAFDELFKHIKINDSTLHMMGLLSSGGVHSHIKHLFAFLETAKNSGIKNIAIHVFTDGRDVPPQSAKEYIKELEEKIKELGVGFIASVSGRFYAMDRDNNWDRFDKSWEVIFSGKGNVCKIPASENIDALYSKGVYDEHIEPFVCEDESGNIKKIEKNDGILFFNFRADRARMMTKKIIENQEEFNLKFVTMTDYGDDYKTLVAFPPVYIETTLAKELSSHGLTQVHVAETEKFAHATYFLNGGVEDPYKGEDQILIPSRKDILTHDLAPKMMAEEIANRSIEKIQEGVDFIFINFANPDMVGHTANVPAIITAIEEVDKQLGRIIEAVNKNNGIVIITADHGNAEVNIDSETGNKHTSHTTNPVPFIISGLETSLDSGTLADITPTILHILEIEKPISMTGRSLIK
jgi:2,3-bisphosphoglycerate-independent phosphoglycerate mutase